MAKFALFSIMSALFAYTNFLLCYLHYKIQIKRINLCEKICMGSLYEGKDIFPFWHSNPLNRTYKVPFCEVEEQHESKGNHFPLSTFPPYKMRKLILLSFYWTTC